MDTGKHSYTVECGTACVSECMLKALVCQDLRFDPSKYFIFAVLRTLPFSCSKMIESVLTTSMSKKGGLLIFGVPETSEFTKPPGWYEFYGFSFRNNQERASKFGSILGRDQGLVNNCSAAARRAPNWTAHTLNSS